MTRTDLLTLLDEQVLTTEHRPLTIRWHAGVRAELGAAFFAQRATLDEGVCEPTRAQVACFTLDPQVPVELLIGMPFGLAMTTGLGNQRVVPLIVTEVIPTTASTQGLSVVNLVGRDPVYFIDQRRRLRTFKDKNVQGVVHAVLDEWVNDSPIAGSFTYRFDSVDSARYPRRACYLQHPDESDAGFIFRLLRSDGWSWYWTVQTSARGGEDADGVPLLELVIFDDWRLLPASPMPVVEYHRRDGTSVQDAIELLAAVYRVVPDGIDVNSWDHEDSRLISSSAYADLDLGDRAARLASVMRSTRYAIDHLGDDPADSRRLANVQADHCAFRAHCLRGRSDVRTLSPGTYQRIDNYPLFAGRGPDGRTYTTIRVTHIIENNLPGELHEAAQALAGDTGLPEWAKAEGGAETTGADKSKGRYTNQFYCVPRGTPIQPSYVEERDAPRQRRLTGHVVAYERSQSETATDSLGRVLVRLLGGEPGADTTVWVRIAVAWGGRNHGHFGALRVGSEVDIEVLGPDRMAVVGVRYNQDTPPPFWDHLPGLPENDAYSGTISREMNGERQQQLRFDDTQGHISVQLGTEHAATQLNIGELTTPMNRGENAPRGDGFELRTDANGSVRTARSLLLTAWRRLQACGNQLDAQEHLALMQDFLNISRSLGQYAAQHLGLAVDDVAATALAADVGAAAAGSHVDPRGEGGEPTISITAPAGVATTTPKTILSYAGVNIDQVARQHWQVTAGQRYNVNAGQGISLFAHHGGLSALAHHGLLRLQSQNGNTTIESSKDIVLAAQGSIKLMAKNIQVISDGAAINLADVLTLMSKGAIVSRGSAFPHSGPDSLELDRPSFGSAPADRLGVLRYGSEPDAPIAANARYRALVSDGTTIEGTTDAQGRVQHLQRDALHIVDVTLIHAPKS